MKTLHLKPNHEVRIKNGHLWAFAGEIVEPLKGLEPGEAVVLCEARGAVLGRGYVNPQSLIAVRLLTRGEEVWDGGLILKRVRAAFDFRESNPPLTPPVNGGGNETPLLTEEERGKRKEEMDSRLRGNDDSTAFRLIYNETPLLTEEERGKRKEEMDSRLRGNDDSTAFRLIYSESDGLPGLIVDKFGDQLVMQSLTVGIEKRLDEVVAALVEVVKPAGIYFKGKSPYRKMEGLPEEDRQIYGTTPDKVLFASGGLTFTARPKEGQKTGYFLDQRGNRGLLAQLIRNYELGIRNGEIDSALTKEEKGKRKEEYRTPPTPPAIAGGEIETPPLDPPRKRWGEGTPPPNERRELKILDLYSYTGGWGLTALQAGAADAVMVDSSSKAIAWGKEDAALNGLEGRAVFVQADVEEFLKDAVKRKKRWDVVIVDPPALIPNRQAVPQGINAYIAINRAALRVVKPGGLMVTCSCSHLLTREKHLEVIGRAAFQEGKRVRIVASGGHAPDHPILPGHPETEYLKCWFLRVES